MFHLKSCVTSPCYWVRDSRHFSNILVFNNVLVVTMVIHILLDICLQTKSVRLLCQSHSLAPQRQSSVMPHIHHPSRCGHWRFCCEQPASVMWQSRNSSNQCPPRTHAPTQMHRSTLTYTCYTPSDVVLQQTKVCGTIFVCRHSQ